MKQPIIVMKIINFFHVVSVIIFQYSFFHAVSEIIFQYSFFHFVSKNIIFNFIYCYFSIILMYLAVIRGVLRGGMMPWPPLGCQ